MSRPQARSHRNGSRVSAKVVVTGPYGAGKTTLIRAISEITVLSTERSIADRRPSGGGKSGGGKSETTVAMDFGRLTIDEGLALYLFGTPGQQRFDFMWEILSEGMLGFVVLVDGDDDASLDDAAGILEFFKRSADVPYVVAVNKSNTAAAAAGDDVVERVRRLLRVPSHVRMVACDARERESVKQVLLTLLNAALDEIDGRMPTPA
ncbi:GTP-binding protein [Egibacter rhizosphaerae]|uniref:GTP-binding protein n=1 Tax=Egibacter rhizosphaerae TaxID=1670831 RepID=A0A411YJY8_9ACTN|nr:ATP/GTP-binding protein [Egibacter rhizosphaerae]QBI21503.1 GTP-binding protein [Egibacter rhizosphaerae]